MGNLTEDPHPCQEKLQTVGVIHHWTAHKITPQFTKRKVKRDL